MGETTVATAVPEDADAIATIYNHYVETTCVTFEEQPVDAVEIRTRMQAVQSAVLPWVVARESDRIIGYAYAMPWKARSAYRFAVELTVYVAHDAGKHGVGSMLYGELIPRLRLRAIHTAIGGIVLPNEASVALHRKFGFRKAAHLVEVGFKFGRWIDVEYWQLAL